MKSLEGILAFKSLGSQRYFNVFERNVLYSQMLNLFDLKCC